MVKKTPLLLSILTLCICTVLVVGGTFALFTDKEIINNHLSAGNLDIALERVSYKECVLNSNGLMVESEDDSVIDLVTNGESLFDVKNAVPTSWYQATIKVDNLGSTAFDYGVKILWEPNDDPEDNDITFAEQIKITVTSNKISPEDTDGIDEHGNRYVSFMLADAAENNLSLGYLLTTSQAESFTVKAEFINNTAVNNDAMLAELKFDVQVYATQKTK